MARLRDHEIELAAALQADIPVGDLLFGLRDPDRIDLATVNAFVDTPMTAATSSARAELALAWIPSDVPVTVHLYMNEQPIVSGSGTVRGGRAFFAIPEAMIVDPRKLTFALSFWQGRWSYQLWGRIDDRKFLLQHGTDPDPASKDDDLVVQSVLFGAP